MKFRSPPGHCHHEPPLVESRGGYYGRQTRLSSRGPLISEMSRSPSLRLSHLVFALFSHTFCLLICRLSANTTEWICMQISRNIVNGPKSTGNTVIRFWLAVAARGENGRGGLRNFISGWTYRIVALPLAVYNGVTSHSSSPKLIKLVIFSCPYWCIENIHFSLIKPNPNPKHEHKRINPTGPI